ncbi:MAG: hypothetical protein ACRYGF_01840 [Janthinobacterium lividum]
MRYFLATMIFVQLAGGGLFHQAGAQEIRVEQPSVQKIAAGLAEMNSRRNAALTAYESRRLMTVAYQGPLSEGEATESVVMAFTAPASKQFTILLATGPQLIRDSVFQRAINAETAAATEGARRASELNLQNYTMQLVGREHLSLGDCYVLEVVPRTASEFTYVGKVWVQATDFAVVRIQGKPAVNPSPWISEGTFTSEFQKVGDFYFPATTVSTSNLPLGMRARLTIQYSSYRILSAKPVPSGGQ